MKLILRLFLFGYVLIAWLPVANAQDPSVVIPVPAEVELMDGVYRFTDEPSVRFRRVSPEKICAEGYVQTFRNDGVSD